MSICLDLYESSSFETGLNKVQLTFSVMTIYNI